MGAVRNCGVYESAFWLLGRVVGVKSLFPLNDLRILEDLVTVAAVDTVAETLAAVSFIIFILAAKISGGSFLCVFDPQSLSVRSGDCLDSEVDFVKAMLTLIVVVISRIVWFLLERLLFRFFVESVGEKGAERS